MAFAEAIVAEFIAYHLYDRSNAQNWLTERIKKELAKESVLNDSEFDRYNFDHILDKLILIDREFQIFIEAKYQDRFTELTEPLIPRLKNGSKQKYYEAFKSIADELFSDGISWTRIVTFIVYNAELVNKVIELSNQKDKDKDKDKDKTFKMVLQIIKCVRRYFEENLLQWIDEQDGGWNDIIEFAKGPNDNTDKNANHGSCRGYKQYLGVAAFAAVIGGLYICSKLTVQ